jgi:hypothetical protein
MEAAGTPRSDSQRTTTRGAGAIVANLGLGLVGVLLLVTVLGFIASRVIDGGLGRSGSFIEVEPPLAYTRWGLMQFTAPLVLVVAPLLIALVVLRVIGRVLVVIPPVRRLWRPVQALSSQTTARIAAMPVRSIGETLLVVQLIALVAYVWRYSPVLSGLANFALPDLLAGDLRQLRPGNVDIHEEWRAVASLQLVAFGVAWYNVVRKRQMSQQTGGGAALAGGLALLMLTALLFAMPYRVLFHAELERVMVGTERCYEAARQASEILVFCPERPTGRSSRMALDDPSLTRTGIIESIFSVFDEPRP